MARRARPRGLRPAIYDGDTPIERRCAHPADGERDPDEPRHAPHRRAPHHDRWGDALHNLRVVVVDEAHVYRGVFGSHVANVLRRLRRLALAYGAEPASCSPRRRSPTRASSRTRLTGLDVEVVDGDTSPRAEREIVLWNPELLDAELGTRASGLGDASRLLAELVAPRPPDDLLHEEPQGGGARASLRERPARRGDRAAARALPCRVHAGAAPRDRAAAGRGRAARRHGDRRARARHRHRLARLRDLGRLPRHGGVAAPAVGSCRATRAGARGADRERGRARPVLRERPARAPRADGRGGADRPRDAAHPRRARPRSRVRGAADRRPTRPCSAPAALERAALLPELEPTAAGYVWRGRDTPAARISLRSGDPRGVRDRRRGDRRGARTAERERAYSTVHEGAVYLHLGEQYGVTTLDLETRTALVQPVAVDWYTQARKETTTSIVASLHRAESPASSSITARSRSPSRSSPSSARRSPTAASSTRRRSTCPRRPSRPRASGSAPARLLDGIDDDADARLRPPRVRARADLAPAALRDVRPLGHRRPVDERPRADRSPDRVRLRRPRRRRRDHGARLRVLRRLGRRHRAAARAVPVPLRVPLVRPEPEVRQPERAPRQGGGAAPCSSGWSAG